MFTQLYLILLKLAKGRYATVLLSGIAFSESIIFPIPPDTVLLPMALANRKKAFYFATLTTFFSVIGGAVGYMIGFFFWDSFGQSLIETLGYTNTYLTFSDLYKEYGVLLILIGALSPVPFKVVAILSGLFTYPFLIFVLVALISRAFRFYLLTAIVYIWGEQIDTFLKNYSALAFGIILLLIAATFMVLK